MDDIIELFSDFEKKFFKLIKHLLIKPRLVFENTINKGTAYTKPFKFYSVISSVALFLILLSNRFDFLKFWDQEYTLPNYWVDYYNNVNEIGLTLLPILGFLFFIVLLALFSFLLFRKPKKGFLIHFSYSMYIVSMLILYFIIVIPIWVFIARLNLFEYGVLEEIMIYTLFFAIPMSYIGWAYWIWAGNATLKTIKIVFMLGAIFYIYDISYIENSPEKSINNQIFYSKDARDEIISDLVPIDTTLIPDNDAFWYFSYNTSYNFNPLVASVSDTGDSLTFERIDKDGIKFINQIVQPNLGSVNLFNYAGHPAYAITQAYNIDLETRTNYLWRITEENTKRVYSDTTLFNVFSILIPHNDRLILTGQNIKNQGSLYEILENGIIPIYSLSDSLTTIDDIIPLSNESNEMLFLSSKLKDKNLESITIHYVQGADSFTTHKTRLFYNTFANIPAHFSGYKHHETKIYKPKLMLSADSTAIYATFQIMTEKSFELQMFTLDRDLNITKQANFTTDHNLTYFDDYFLYEDDFYVVGRIFTIVAKGISVSDENNGRYFIAKFNPSNWVLEDMKIIDKRSWFGQLNLYSPDIHLEVNQDSIHVFRFEVSVEKWSIAKF